jgi:predicted CxxxxCH...CXXCH cytochrome family protein
MWNKLVSPITAALLGLGSLGLLGTLGGCSKLETPNKAENSCDLCHSAPLSKSAVHRIHLTTMSMATFPILDPVAASIPIENGNNDSTFKYRVMPGYKFSNSASINQATHYQQTRLLNHPIKCAACHQGMDSLFVRNNAPNHRNGKKDAAFDEGYLREKYFNPKGNDTVHFDSSIPGSMSYDGTSCDNIICHGAGRKGVQQVVWNTSAKVTDTLSCMTCHNTKKHKEAVACDKCHYDVTLDNGKTIHNFRKHLNDSINYGRY